MEEFNPADNLSLESLKDFFEYFENTFKQMIDAETDPTGVSPERAFSLAEHLGTIARELLIDGYTVLCWCVQYRDQTFPTDGDTKKVRRLLVKNWSVDQLKEGAEALEDLRRLIQRKGGDIANPEVSEAIRRTNSAVYHTWQGLGALDVLSDLGSSEGGKNERK